MLARSFKTAVELEISDAMHKALVTVLGMMERGEIKDGEARAERGFTDFDYSNKTPTMFDMGRVFTDYECGTAGCILGWAIFVDKDILYDSSERTETDSGLHHLMFPNSIKAINCVSVDQGRKALQSYLTTGNPRWGDALK